MNKKVLLVFSCVLLALSFSACKKCKDSFSAYIQNDYVPYSQGSTFAMTDSSGRVIHFTASAYSDRYLEYRTSIEQECVDGAQVVEANFTSDSTGVSIALYQQGNGSNGVSTEDAFLLTIQLPSVGRTLHMGVSSSTLVATDGSTATSLGTQTIGNRNYSDVYEVGNTAHLQAIAANNIWYNKSEGILKIGFNDGTYWTIVN